MSEWLLAYPEPTLSFDNHFGILDISYIAFISVEQDWMEMNFLKTPKRR